jgi:hypothetical protein
VLLPRDGERFEVVLEVFSRNIYATKILDPNELRILNAKIQNKFSKFYFDRVKMLETLKSKTVDCIRNIRPYPNIQNEMRSKLDDVEIVETVKKFKMTQTDKMAKMTKRV